MQVKEEKTYKYISSTIMNSNLSKSVVFVNWSNLRSSGCQTVRPIENGSRAVMIERIK